MAVQSTIQVESKTTGAVTGTSSSSWQLGLRISHATDPGATTAIADLEVYIGVHHYWLPSTFSGGLAVSINNSGQVYGSITGTIGTCTATIVDHNDLTNKPIIYPHGSNAKVKAVIKLTWNGNATFTGTGNGITDCNISIQASNNRQTKLYDGSTDMEDSYSYNGNTGYTANSKIWIKDSSAGSALRYGTEPDYDAYDLAVISVSNCSYIDAAAPTTSYETAIRASVTPGSGSNAKRAVFTFTDPSIGATVDTILRCEFLPICEQQNYLNPATLDCAAMSSTPDATPTWNECAANFSTVQDSMVVGANGFQYGASGWLFNSATLDTLVKSWLNDWATNHKGLGVKFATEGTTNGQPDISTDNQTNADMHPIIVVAYTTGGGGSRRIFNVT